MQAPADSEKVRSAATMLPVPINLLKVTIAKSINILITQIIKYDLIIVLPLCFVHSRLSLGYVFEFRLSHDDAVAGEHGKVIVAVHDAHIAATAEEHAPREERIGCGERQLVTGEVVQIRCHILHVEDGFLHGELCHVARIVHHQHASVNRWHRLRELMEPDGGGERHAVTVAHCSELLHECEEREACRARPVAVDLHYLFGSSAGRG